MRKIIALLLAAAMAMGMVACSGGETTKPQPNPRPKRKPPLKKLLQRKPPKLLLRKPRPLR